MQTIEPPWVITPTPTQPPSVVRHFTDVHERVRLDDLEKSHMAGAGNYLYKVEVAGRPMVLKIYNGTRSWLLYVKKTFGNVVLTGRSSHMPQARCRMELACIDAWERAGFRCFGRYPNVELEGLPRDGYMAYEYVPGRHFRDYFQDKQIPLEERMAMWRRWLPEWNRRHQAAIDTGDSKLIHENGDVKHVMIHEDEFVYFDFEMIYTSSDIRMLVGREILAYMRSVGRFFGHEMYVEMMNALVDVYPDKSLLLSAWEFAWAHPNRVWRVLRAIDRNVKPANKKRYSKYRVAVDLKRRLVERSLTTQSLPKMGAPA